MTDCFEVLERSVIVSTKREVCDQLGQLYALSLQNVKLEWPSGMSSSGDARHETTPFQSSYTGFSLGDRRGLNSHLQHYYSKQFSQGGSSMNSDGMCSQPLVVSTESSTGIDTWSCCEVGGSVSQKARINQTRPAEEQGWVDVLAPGSLVVSSTLSQLENNGLNATLDFGVPRHHIEDVERMFLPQASDPAILKWFLGDGQMYGQGDIQPLLGSRDLDTMMFEQDSWSSNQYQSCHHNVGNSLSRQVLHECTTGDTFASLIPSISLSSSSSKLNSDSSFLQSSYSCLPRAVSLPSHLDDISLNFLSRTEFTGPPLIANPIASIDGTGGNSVSGSRPFTGVLPSSPNAPAAGEYYPRSLLVGNSMTGGQLSYSVHEASFAMEEEPVTMQGSLSSALSSVPAPNLPSLTSGYYHQEIDQEVGQRNIMVRSFASLVSNDSENQAMKSPSVMSWDYLLQRQRSWTGGRVCSPWNENRRPEATGQFKSENVLNSTGYTLSPFLSVPLLFPSSPQHAGCSFQQAGVERESEDVKPDTGQMEGGVIPEGGLAIVNLLLRAAEAVDIGNAEMAKAILARLNQHISPTREKSIHRVAHYFREALVTRLLAAENFVAQLSQDRTLTPLEEFHKINAYVRFCEVSPYPKFAHFTANQAILEALDGEEAMHIIDFQMGAGAQWASFLQDIASLKAAGKVISKVRLTAVGTRADEIRATGANLCNFAQMMNIALEFQAVVTRPECLDVSMLGLRDNEAVAGNFIFSLHELLDGETSNGLSSVLESVLKARPKVVTTVEQEGNHSGPFFQQRFSEALQYYMFLFDSLTSSLEAGADSSVNSSIESYLLAPEIMNIVACDGVARVERHERLEQWRVRMLKMGFSPRPLSVASQVQAERLVNQISARAGFQVSRDQGGLLLGWQGRPLLAASSWIC
ncbi:hypothetical protein M758_UG182100 [Ceratodon purpureus]|nr:hypothetical protein M758_UG182100 [Ceratodon purpureus]KAG0595618.1 hypothetical protein M758_UG182100 [Ceratodon purpureus]